MTDKEKVLEGLQMDFQKSGETKIMEGIGGMANSFGSLDKDLRPMILTNERTKKNFIVLAALCGACMGYTYQCEIEYGRGHWDMRNEAAARFCCDHQNEFADLYEEISGRKIRYKEGAEHQSFIRDCLALDRETMKLPVVSEIRSFCREHPTLQQKMMGAFIRILDELCPEYGFGSVGFPFV